MIYLFSDFLGVIFMFTLWTQKIRKRIRIEQPDSAVFLYYSICKRRGRDGLYIIGHMKHPSEERNAVTYTCGIWVGDRYFYIS